MEDIDRLNIACLHKKQIVMLSVLSSSACKHCCSYMYPLFHSKKLTSALTCDARRNILIQLPEAPTVGLWSAAKIMHANTTCFDSIFQNHMIAVQILSNSLGTGLLKIIAHFLVRKVAVTRISFSWAFDYLFAVMHLAVLQCFLIDIMGQ